MTGRKLKEAGQQLALIGAGNEWLDATMSRFQTFCKARIEAGQPNFKFEDFRNTLQAEGAAQPHSPNAFGALPRIACKSGLIQFTGDYQNATSPKTRSHPVKVWRAI